MTKNKTKQNKTNQSETKQNKAIKCKSYNVLSNICNIWKISYQPQLYLMVKCVCCFVTYHLGMILAIIQVAPVQNRTKLLVMQDLHSNNYCVGTGKEKTKTQRKTRPRPPSRPRPPPRPDQDQDPDQDQYQIKTRQKLIPIPDQDQDQNHGEGHTLTKNQTI